LGVDRVFGDGRREVRFGAYQVVQVVLRYSAQEVAFVGVFIEPQQGVERADGFTVVVVHHAALAHPEEILPVVLRPGPQAAQQRRAQHDECDDFPHLVRTTCFSGVLFPCRSSANF